MNEPQAPEPEPSAPVTLPAVLPPEESSAAQDVDGSKNLAELENVQLSSGLSIAAIEAATLKNELARAHIKNVDADRLMRTTYAGRILKYLEFYSGSVAALLVLSGFHLGGFVLSIEVLATLVGSTAVAAIGLVGFIARGLFRPPHSHH